MNPAPPGDPVLRDLLDGASRSPGSPAWARLPSWLVWTLIALVSWGIWAVLSKAIGEALSAGLSQALSTLGVLPIVLPLALSRLVTWNNASRRGMGLAILGGIITCLGNVAYYGAVARGQQVATVVSVTALYPLVTVLLAMAVLGERLNVVQVAGVLLSLVAIWLFNVTDGSRVLSPTLVFAVLPIVLWGLSGFLQKLATVHLTGEAAAVLYLAAFLPVAAFFLWREPWPGSVSWRTWGLVIALGFFLAFGNLAMLIAFARGGKAAVIAPLGGLYPLVGVPVAVGWLGESVSRREVIGIVVALVSVVALAFERRAPAGAVPATPESGNAT